MRDAVPMFTSWTIHRIPMNTFHQLMHLASRAKREHWHIVERGLFLSDHEMKVRLRMPASAGSAGDDCAQRGQIDIPAEIYDRAPS